MPKKKTAKRKKVVVPKNLVEVEKFLLPGEVVLLSEKGMVQKRVGKEYILENKDLVEVYF